MHLPYDFLPHECARGKITPSNSVHMSHIEMTIQICILHFPVCSPPEKKCMSLDRSRPCARLHATHPPSPCAQVLTLAVIGRGSLSSLKVVCQPTSGCEEDSTLDPTRVVGRASLVGSRIVIPSDARGGEVLEGASSVTLGSCSVVRCLFRPGGGGGGVGFLP